MTVKGPDKTASPPEVSERPSTWSRRDFLRVSARGSAAVTALWALEGPGLTALAEGYVGGSDELSIAELGQRMAEGSESCLSITRFFLERIQRLDQNGPRLASILEVNPEALEIAAALDRERLDQGPRGPLHGVPVVLKDNIDTADKMHTSAGSLALAKSIPEQDAWVAERLRAAGALILAKANLSEWANFRSTRSSSGWSGRGGQARNPYALDRSPCGSSSGSAVAVAANLCSASIGTETNGSIVCPAGTCGVVGLKPTVGLVGRSGIIPIAHSQDTAGPMGRSVADVAALLGALVGDDPRDATTSESRAHRHADYTTFLDAKAMDGARVGVLRQSFGFHEGVDALLEGHLESMRRAGAVLVDPLEIDPDTNYRRASGEVLRYEFKHDLDAYLASLPASTKIRSLEDLIEFNQAHSDQEMPWFGQELFLQSQLKGPLTDETYKKALVDMRRGAREEGIDKALAEHRLDAIVAPTNGPGWKIDPIVGDNFLGGSSSLAAIAGYPNLTIPAGLVHSLPIGMSFFAGAWSEPRLLALGYAFEQLTQARQAPTFRRNVEGIESIEAKVS